MAERGCKKILSKVFENATKVWTNIENMMKTSSKESEGNMKAEKLPWRRIERSIHSISGYKDEEEDAKNDLTMPDDTWDKVDKETKPANIRASVSSDEGYNDLISQDPEVEEAAFKDFDQHEENTQTKKKSDLASSIKKMFKGKIYIEMNTLSRYT